LGAYRLPSERLACGGQKESRWQTNVFMVEPGARFNWMACTASRAAARSRTCGGEDECEDALSIKGISAGSGSVALVLRVVQDNDLGTVSIQGFFAQDFGKFYRSCGTCDGKSRKGFIKTFPSS
jgi:hypothetical protein